MQSTAPIGEHTKLVIKKLRYFCGIFCQKARLLMICAVKPYNLIVREVMIIAFTFKLLSKYPFCKSKFQHVAALSRLWHHGKVQR